MVERVRGGDEAGRTLLVETGATAFQQAVRGAPPPDARLRPRRAGRQAATQFGMRPRVRSGWALKRLDASEGERRYILKDLRSNTFVRMTAARPSCSSCSTARRSLVDLIAAAEQRLGPTGPGRLAALLADLGDRGLLAGVDGHARPAAAGRAAGADDPPREIVDALGRPAWSTRSTAGAAACW